jgi:hypothetical protein
MHGVDTYGIHVHFRSAWWSRSCGTDWPCRARWRSGASRRSGAGWATGPARTTRPPRCHRAERPRGRAQHEDRTSEQWPHHLRPMPQWEDRDRRWSRESPADRSDSRVATGSVERASAWRIRSRLVDDWPAQRYGVEFLLRRICGVRLRELTTDRIGCAVSAVRQSMNRVARDPRNPTPSPRWSRAAGPSPRTRRGPQLALGVVHLAVCGPGARRQGESVRVTAVGSCAVPRENRAATRT